MWSSALVVTGTTLSFTQLFVYNIPAVFHIYVVSIHLPLGAMAAYKSALQSDGEEEQLCYEI